MNALTAPSRCVEILGVRVNSISLNDLLERITASIQSQRHALFAYVNIYALNLAYETDWLRAFLNSRAEVVFCDGFGVKLGARILGEGGLHRHTPPDWLPQLCAICARNNFSIYIMGARPGVAEKAADRLITSHPGLRIAGCDHGYHEKAAESADNREVLARIRAARPDVLIVGLGMPLQERWLLENWAAIDAHVVIPVGAAIDYLAGEVVRAPRWMTDRGLEWLGRLVIEPRRLWRRYLIGNPLFFFRIIKQRLGLLKLDPATILDPPGEKP